MKLHQLPKIKNKSKKRIGRGIGSGKGKTGGRGTKGQKARGKIALSFSGGGLPLYKKIPFLRGHRNKPVSPKAVALSLTDLNKFKAHSTVDLETVIRQGLVSEKQAKKFGVKILNNGAVKIPLDINIPISKSAKKKIEEAGGKIILA